MIYLDSSATTMPKQAVLDAMIPYLTYKWYNPSSLYDNAVEVRKDIEKARKTIADFINAKPEEIYFTSGASESNNCILQGFTRSVNKNGNKAAIITSNIEHKSIEDCVEGIKNINCQCWYTGVDNDGFVNLNNIEKGLEFFNSHDNFKPLVTVIHANNEIGTIQDIESIAELTHKYRGVFHSDCTQSFGKIPIDVKELGIDMMSASAHKIGGLKGVGFLYIKNGIEIEPLIYGSQERGLRGGTENVAGIIGFAKAVELCDVSADVLMFKQSVKFNIMKALKNNFGCKFNGDINGLPNIISATFPDVTGESLLYTLDLADIQVSVGSACNSRSIEPSHVLKAIGLSNEEAMRTIRISLPDISYYGSDEYDNMLYEFLDELNKAIKIITS